MIAAMGSWLIILVVVVALVAIAAKTPRFQA
jgi:hypothetical protein